MKKFFFLSFLMLAVAGCSKEEAGDPAGPDRSGEKVAPHFYGCAMLENPAPQTRGVANKMKIWSKMMASDELTVKFLNGTPEFQAYVKEVSAEWEKYAGVRFRYVTDNTKDALIRIGFDYVRGMQTSWSYTGTDIEQLYDMQDEPTMHFAQWRRISDEKRRSDVLRAFGQTLGLELEFRHPSWDPGWIKNADGTLNEAEIQRYWEDELAEFITWEELKKMVLDPIGVNARFIAKTESYDPKSVMNWPFFEEIASHHKPVGSDSDYNTELSEQDKMFIRSLYGEPFNNPVRLERYLPLIEYTVDTTSTQFSVLSNKRLIVVYDEHGEDYTYLDLPTDTTTVYTYLSTELKFENGPRKIVIGEVLEPDQPMPLSSTAIKSFSCNGIGMENLDIKPHNLGLNSITVSGGKDFKAQDFYFANQMNLKEIYLIQTLGSTLTLVNCPNIEIVGTTTHMDKGIDGWDKPYTNYSLGDESGNGLALNSRSVKRIYLDNTQIKHLDLSQYSNLEYVYLSSFPDYIVGGGEPAGQYLVDMFNTLPQKSSLKPGVITLRGVLLYFQPTYPGIHIVDKWDTDYAEVAASAAIFNELKNIAKSRNWLINYKDGYKEI